MGVGEVKAHGQKSRIFSTGQFELPLYGNADREIAPVPFPLMDIAA